MMYKKVYLDDTAIILLVCEVDMMIKRIVPAIFLVFFTLVTFSVYFLYQLSVFAVKVMVYAM